jgi:segregation and condensation protein B
VALSRAALEVLAVVAYRQPVSQAGIDHSRGASSDSALAGLLQRGLVAVDEHRLLRTTPEFLHYLGLRDLADLPSLPDPDPSAPDLDTVVVPATLTADRAEA